MAPLVMIRASANTDKTDVTLVTRWPVSRRWSLSHRIFSILSQCGSRADWHIRPGPADPTAEPPGELIQITEIVDFWLFGSDRSLYSYLGADSGGLQSTLLLSVQIFFAMPQCSLSLCPSAAFVCREKKTLHCFQLSGSCTVCHLSTFKF